MKFSVSARQPHPILRVADEIKVQFKDIDYIFNLDENYPTKRLVIEIGHKEEVSDNDWNILKAHQEHHQGAFYICIYNYEHVKKCKDLGLKFYYGIPADTMYKLRAYKNLGCAFAIIEAPLIFDLDAAKQIGISLRAVPNMGITDNIPRQNGIHGGWIRPEDIPAYEEYIDTFEFKVRDMQHERGLLAVYRDGYWRDDLNLLITGLNYSVPNYRIGKRFVDMRLNCKQKCETRQTCQKCEVLLRSINRMDAAEQRKKELLEKMTPHET